MFPVDYDISVKLAEPFEAVLPPANVHPRLYVRDEDLEVVGRRTLEDNIFLVRMQSLINAGKYDELALANKTDMVHFTHMAPRHIIQDVLDTAISRAILYVVDRKTNQSHGKKALESAIHFMSTYECTWTEDIYLNGNNTCMIIHALSCIYDWCYDLLTDRDKAFFIEKFDYYLTYLEFSRTIDGKYLGWEQGFTGSAMNGHHMEHQIAAVTALGIALYDEKPYYWEVISNFMFNHVFPTSNFLLQQGTVWQGAGYGPGRLQHLAHSNLLMYRMQDTGCRKSFLTQDAVKALYSMIYYRRPDGQTLRMGDVFNTSTPFGVEWVFGECNCILYLNAIYHDPYLQTELIKLEKVRKLQAPIAFILWDKVEPKPYSGNLPQVYYMPYPNGEILATTGWQESVDFNSSVMHVDMRFGVVQPFNHEHLDSGSFQIYYKGALAVDSGMYEGTMGAYGGPHDINWNKRTISHNCFLIHDPDYDKKFDMAAPCDDNSPHPDKFVYWGRRVVSDGGQLYCFAYEEGQDMPLDVYPCGDGVVRYFPRNGQCVELHGPDSKWWTGQILSHYIEPETLAPRYTYLKGDLAQLYGYRAKEANRSFVFLNFEDTTYPGALIVFDRIVTGDSYPDYLDYEKYFLLHSINAPDVIRDKHGKVDSFLIKRTEDAVKDGRVVGKYNGQMLCTPLLPVKDNLRLKVVNGYDVFGEEFPNHAIGKPAEEAGEWMLMVSPKAKAQTDMMLNVMQVSDAGTECLPVVMVGGEAEDMVGAKIFGRVAMFSTNGKLIEASVVVPKAADCKEEVTYHIADLAPGKWVATASNDKSQDKPMGESQSIDAEFVVTTEGNIGVFVGNGALEYVITRR